MNSISPTSGNIYPGVGSGHLPAAARVSRQADYNIIGSWEFAKVVILSPETYKPVFIMLIARILSLGVLATCGQNVIHKKLMCFSQICSYRVLNIFAKKYFGSEHIIGSSRNIARWEDIQFQMDHFETNQLIDSCKTLLQNPQYRAITLDTVNPPRTMITTGICNGIQLDVAEQNLVRGNSVEKIVEWNAEGASDRAAANQAVLLQLQHNNDPQDRAFVDILDRLQAQSNCPGIESLFRVNFRMVGHALVKIDDAIKYHHNYRVLREQYNDRTRAAEGEETSKFVEMICSAVEKARSSRPDAAGLSVFDGSRWTIVDPIKFQAYVQEEFRKASASEQEMNALKWVAAFLRVKENCRVPGNTTINGLSRISNETIKNAFEQLTADIYNLEIYRLVAKVRGLEVNCVDEIMGYHYQHASDEAYLQNLNRLSEGVYALDFDLNDGGHSTTFIKNNNGTGYILDPNGYQLKFNNNDQAVRLLLKLLRLYPEPENRKSASRVGPNHHLTIHKFEKITVAQVPAH